MKKFTFKKFEPEGFNGKIWGQALKENVSLLHLDLSYNKFEQKDT